MSNQKYLSGRSFLRTDQKTIKRLVQLYRAELFRNKSEAVVFISLITVGHIFRYVVVPLLLSFLIQTLLTSPGSTAAYWLIGGIAVSAIISTYINDKGYSKLFNHEETVHTRLLDMAVHHLMQQSYQFFSNQKVGTLAGEAMNFSRSYQTVMDAYFLQTSQLMIGLVASLIVVAILSPLLLVPLSIITVGIIVLNIRNLRERAPYRNERKERTSQLTGTIADIMGNQILTRVFSQELAEAQGIQEERKRIETVARKEIRIIERESLYRQAMTYSFQIITLLLAVWLFSRDMVSIAALVFMITYLIRTSESIFGISSLIRNFEQAFLDAAPMMRILEMKPSVIDAKDATKLHVTEASIEYRNVSFSYDDANNDSVFENLSLTIQPGEKVGFAGRSGGGKTTLTKILLRFADIQSGAIVIDGQDISKATQSSVRSAISYVPQEPYLFHRSLRDNIAYGKTDATEPEIIAAAKKAHAMEFIEDLPHGLNTIVGERGVKLSGGQRQRIAIARAILKDAPILILDEATSALDSESERLIQDALDKLMKNKTSIVIAHRLSTIAKLDRIIVLDNGNLTEDGTHDELIAQDGDYAMLWKHQSGGFLEE